MPRPEIPAALRTADESVSRRIGAGREHAMIAGRRPAVLHMVKMYNGENLAGASPIRGSWHA
jgi:hypothetical protein